MFSLDYKAAGFTSETEFNQVKNNPAILHFTTGSKPWHYLNLHPFKEEYFKYLDCSLFPYIKFSEKDFLDSTGVVVFGTGKYAEQITDRLQLLGIEIAYYTDNNTEKWGSYFFGKIIKKPSALLDDTPKFIIIASQYHSEIANQLKSMGLKEHCHFLKDISDNTEIKL
ncbi:General stress protein A [compost metagenome]